ncbi:MAG TPA: hypothetical protein VLT88_14930, partial [Desulfosarcina sp.]|nr:hypothetical protein [Desulfosarcina sp.]
NDNEKIADQVRRAGEQLFRFAIDRGDMQTILDALPVQTQTRRVAMEYEIQMLRIVTVGWAIAFFLAEDRMGAPLGASFWEHVRAFSETLSSSAALAANAAIDYFDVLKQRLDHYVDALNAAGKISDPAMAVGPAFAEACGYKQDACAVLAGSKMFSHTVHAVHDYLDGIVARQD